MQNKQTWVKTSLGDTTKIHLKEWLKNQKRPNHVFVIYFKCFHNYKLLFFDVYQFHALICGLKFILDQKLKNILKNIIN